MPMNPLARSAAALLLGALALCPSTVTLAQQTPATSEDLGTPLDLPLRLSSLINHTGISVPDVTASALFYSKLFGGDKVGGEMVPMPNGQPPSARYFLFVDDANVAIGLLGTLGSAGQTTPLIDHIAVTAVDHDGRAWRARLKAENLRYIASEVFLDTDGIPIQVAGGVGGEPLTAAGATPAKLPVLFSGKPLTTCLGFDHILLRVPDVEAKVAFWKRLFGVEKVERRNGIAWLSDGTRRLGFRPLRAGEKPGYEYQAFRIGKISRFRLERGLVSLGATLQKREPYDAKDTVRFIGPDGIRTALVQN
jgi:catechol 2,3-dioxygenase-like lactoylglutathione lyase family enzyme